MKSIARVLKSTALGGVVFLLPLVILVVILEKAFKIIRTVSDPISRLLPVDAVAGYAVADILAVIALFLVALVAGLLAQHRHRRGPSHGLVLLSGRDTRLRGMDE